jgi:hypothetical protein
LSDLQGMKWQLLTCVRDGFQNWERRLQSLQSQGRAEEGALQKEKREAAAAYQAKIELAAEVEVRHARHDN